MHTSSLIFFWNVLVHSWWSHSQNFRLLLECKWTLGSLQCLWGQHYASVADGRWNTKLLTHFHIINPLTPKISLVILLTVCQMILIMLILRIWYWTISKPIIDIFSSWLVCMILGWFSKTTGTSLDDSARSANTQIRTESRLFRLLSRRHLTFPSCC